MKNFFLLHLLLVFYAANAQQTLGLFENSPESFNGYTLFAPMQANSTYLIDNCGELVHSWVADGTPAFSVRLDKDGRLLRTGVVSPTPFLDGSTKGGMLELYDWGGSLIWSYVAADSTSSHHHDAELLPNGNVLVIMVDRKTRAEAIAAGRDSTTLSASVWSEKVVELRPIGPDSAEVVWEWRLWDHLVQDYDATKPDFGVVADHPGLLNLNYVPDANLKDWIHLNSIVYNEELDQILLCSRHINELWVIDHSTTTAEAAGHVGGGAGRGGDLLYRWGNPAAYDREGVQESFGLHGADWLQGGAYDGGIVFYNNGHLRPGIEYSSVDIVVPPILPDNSYEIGAVDPFLPLEPDFRYTAPDSVSFYSVNISGTNSLPNGNILVCEGRRGRFFEINLDKEVVWDYVNPISVNGPQSQGDTPSANLVFKVERYPVNFEGFSGRNLTPLGPLEVNPLPSTCTLTTAVVESEVGGRALAVYPNPAKQQFFVELDVVSSGARLLVVDVLGQEALQQEAQEGIQVLDVSALSAGVYLLVLQDGSEQIARKIIVSR